MIDIHTAIRHSLRNARRFSLRGLDKVHVEFGIVAFVHNLLKVAGIRLPTFLKSKKESEENETVFPTFFTFLGTF
ncbi:hypothetical protein ASG16_009395 [Brevibacillus sp. Leaf182]|nr:hypothetical protein ASG16_009395 [Brevibacillus sp. Leaf182]